MLRRLNAPQRGMTLVEVVAALFVFSLVTLGVFPLLASSVRGTNLSRSFTVGKNVGVKAMERIRGLPYSLNQLGVLDVLDMYLPNAQAPNYSGGVYTTVCTSTSTSPSCPRDIPSGYSIEFRAAFVPFGGGAPIVVTSTQYPSSNLPKEQLPSQMVDISVITKWNFPGTQEQYTLRTLVGDRKFGVTKISGVARVDHGVQVLTSYNSGSELRDLTVTGGVAHSTISLRTSAEANQVVQSGVLRVVDASDPSAPDVALFEGASDVLSAPPDATQGAIDQGEGVVSLLDVGEVAGLDDTQAGDSNPSSPLALKVSTANDLPLAQGGFGYEDDDDDILWVDNPVALRPGPLDLDSDERLFALRSDDSDTLTGYTSASTGALGTSDRGVTTLAHVEFKDLRLLPTEFASGGVIQIEEFVADVSCDSTVTASAAALRSWSARVRYWIEPPGSGGSGDYSPWVPIGSASVTDELDVIETENPLVNEDEANLDASGTSPNDVYLFPVSHEHVTVEGTINHDHSGYLETWDMLENLGPGTVSGDRRVTTASVDNAITIVTAPIAAVSPYAPAQVTVSIGFLSCEARDNR